MSISEDIPHEKVKQVMVRVAEDVVKDGVEDYYKLKQQIMKEMGLDKLGGKRVLKRPSGSMVLQRPSGSIAEMAASPQESTPASASSSQPRKRWAKLNPSGKSLDMEGSLWDLAEKMLR